MDDTTQLARAKNRRPTAALLLEAGIYVVIATLAIRLLAFDRLARTLEKTAGSRRQASYEQAYWIGRSVRAWGKRLPWRAKCFEEGLAAAWMLRRRGLKSVLHYGARQTDDVLKAHVWVSSGTIEVIGHASKDGFAEVARFGS